MFCVLYSLLVIQFSFYFFGRPRHFSNSFRSTPIKIILYRSHEEVPCWLTDLYFRNSLLRLCYKYLERETYQGIRWEFSNYCVREIFPLL
jgi:hypothetical protein